MNKEELIKEFDERQKALRDEFISKLEDDKKECGLTYPEDRKPFYYIDSADGKISTTVYYTNDIDCNFLFEHGYFFELKEEAEQYLKERKLLFKLQQWSKLKNDGWEPDWSNDDEEKYYITYFEGESIELSWEITWGIMNFSKLPYFKTHELARECIERFGDEIKEVLC